MDDRIERVEVKIVSVPLPAPVAWSNVKVTEREYVLVWIRTADGGEGLGFTVGSRFRGGATVIRSAIENALSPVIVGRDPAEIERLLEDMAFETLLLGARGAVTRGLSAIDIALWDLLARRAGLPLCDLLGRYRLRVPAYASGGYYYHDDPERDLENLEEEVRRHVDLGFRAVKIKIGRLPIREDLRRVERVFEAVGPGVKVAVDCNHAWADASSAIRDLRLLDDLGLWWIEEPVLPDRMKASARIAAELTTPVATGEIEAGLASFQRLIDTGAADILQPDATVVGGITEWVKIAHAAEAQDIVLAPHWVPDIHVHLGAATPNVEVLEYFHAEVGVLNFESLLEETLRFENGELLVPPLPGHGIRLDQDAVDRFEVKR